MIFVRKSVKNVEDSFGPVYMKNFDRNDISRHKTFVTWKLPTYKLYNGSCWMVFISKFYKKSFFFFAKQFL